MPVATAELTARLVLASHDVRQGGMLTGQLIVESHGARALAMYGSGSGLAPTVYDPARPGVVGMFNGAMTADLHAYLLQAGDVVSIPVTLNGARCGGANGENSMPPGDYTVRASVGFVEPVDLSTVAMSDLLGLPVVATVTADANVHIIRA
jgi:hypothetical protein